VRGGVLVESKAWQVEHVIGSLVAAERGELGAGARQTGQTLLVCSAPQLSVIEEAFRELKLPYVRCEGGASKRRSLIDSTGVHVLASYGMLIAKDCLMPPADVPGMPGWRSKSSARSDSPRETCSHLHRIQWRRAVFFDAQRASNPNTQRAKAAALIRADLRWAVVAPQSRGKRPNQAGLLRLIGHDAAVVGARAGTSLVRTSSGVVADIGGALTLAENDNDDDDVFVEEEDELINLIVH